MLATLLATFAAYAQDATEVDDIGPAVDTSAVEPAVDADTDAGRDIDAIEPGVTSPSLSDDVTRSTTGSRVMDSMQLGRTEITGSQELPKVLYIVPWQKADPGDLMGKPVNTLLDEILAPIDREEFVRQVDYYNDLYGEDEE